MRALAALLLFVTPAPVLAAAAGVSFRSEPLADVLKDAKARKLKVFVDVYASWCGPCHRMDAQVFAKPDVAAALAKDWIAVKIDGEKGEGPEVAKKYHVVGYPTVLFLDADGAEIDRVFGELPADEFVATAGAWAKGEKTLAADEALFFEKSPMDFDKAASLAERFAVRGQLEKARRFLALTEELAHSVLEVLWRCEKLSDEDRDKQVESALVAELNRRLARQVETMLAVAKFGFLRGAKDFKSAKVLALRVLIKQPESKVVRDARAILATADHGLGDDESARSDLDKFLGDKPDAHVCNAYAWWTFQNKTFMDDGLKIAKKGLDLDPKDDGLWDTLAELQFATGHGSDAVASEQKALALNPDEAAYYKSQIEKFSGKK